MTAINTNSLSAYPAAFATPVKTDASSTSDATSASVNLRGNVYQAPKASPDGVTQEQLIKQIQEQIKQTQKMLEQQQQQLAAVQASKASDQEKAAQVMAIQQQIAATSAQLMAQQSALLQLMKGSVNTTA
ncbi:hypothetical protein N5D61_19230 [Pseudomonas sp. GD03842]|uniref:hypothetical protein n=1 Tax=Pseudomonas sp. GD03842 TaxID=2975385 RepID=UPI00244CFE35|nr:hypothetical protein [Pseudomonas sp. GD03842]MDH0748459.1 hypothetical protein [Pseudomonas sp. GD03842]